MQVVKQVRCVTSPWHIRHHLHRHHHHRLDQFFLAACHRCWHPRPSDTPHLCLRSARAYNAYLRSLIFLFPRLGTQIRKRRPWHSTHPPCDNRTRFNIFASHLNFLGARDPAISQDPMHKVYRIGPPYSTYPHLSYSLKPWRSHHRRQQPRS